LLSHTHQAAFTNSWPFAKVTQTNSISCLTALNLNAYSQHPKNTCRATIYGPNPQLTVGLSGSDIEYVDHWPNSGHIVTNSNDDEADITFRHIKLCGQIIINVLCFLKKCCAIVKAKLLTTNCYSVYGSVQWDLPHPRKEIFCYIWPKGLWRALGLPGQLTRLAGFYQALIWAPCQFWTSLLGVQLTLSRHVFPAPATQSVLSPTWLFFRSGVFSPWLQCQFLCRTFLLDAG
jgi:hypothetical protein